MRKHEQYNIMKAYEAGEITRFEAMDKLGIEHLRLFLELRNTLGVQPPEESVAWQNEKAEALEAYFADE